MRKVFTILIYTFIILMIGRNLTLLPRFTLFSNPESELKTLRGNITKVIKDKKGSYSIYIADLEQQASLGINEKQIHTGASVNKIHIVSTLYYLANRKMLDLDEQITLQKVDIQDYGTGRLRYENPGGTYSLKTLAHLALNESDNTAAHILANRIGTENVQAIIDSWGLKQTDIENNKTSVYDCYLLFKRIYAEKVTSPASTKELLGFMKDTDIEDRLPLLLPEKQTVVYHKTGDAVGSLHDVGIVQWNNHIFFIGVLTSDIGTNEKQTKEAIASIAKSVIDFHQQRQ